MSNGILFKEMKMRSRDELHGLFVEAVKRG